MDPVIRSAARALREGSPLAALRAVALRDDAPALALRGIAVAQLGDLDRARALLQRATRAYAPLDPDAHARCVLAAAEVELALRRNLRLHTEPLEAAIARLEARGDRANAAHGRLLKARRLLLLGESDAAEAELARLARRALPPPLATVRELVAFELAVRALRAKEARTALARAERWAHAAGVAALSAEVAAARAALEAPMARLLAEASEQLLSLDTLASALRARGLLVDACRRSVQQGATRVELARRPMLFRLARLLAEAYPGDCGRDELARTAFGARALNASHRVRLRVEISRLREALRELAVVRATARGYLLAPLRSERVLLLLPLRDDEDAAVLAVLADGRAWSSSALALALGVSQRKVQRVLSELERAGKVLAHGRGQQLRWSASSRTRLATSLLLLAPGVRASVGAEVHGDAEP